MKPRSIKVGYSVLVLLLAAPVALANGVDDGASDAQPNGTPSNLFTSTTTKNAAGQTVVVNSVFHNIADTLIYIVGAVAVIMLIIGGLRYVISQGSSEAVKQAKDTILYAIIGIVVAILAYAVVNFVTHHVS
jgi:hypothetical protein